VSILSKITTKPWLPDEGVMDEYGPWDLPPAKLALGWLLAALTVMFCLFGLAYGIRMDLEDWRPVSDPQVLWLNTAVLVLCSFAFQMARGAASRENRSQLALYLALGGVLTIGFLIGQLYAWDVLNKAGYYLTSNPANAFFYLLTALHGIHLIGGLVVWTRATFRVLRGVEVADLRLSVELCATYWHFLLLVWVAMFALLLAT
jgi:cytochrome c oxidase subunit 3